VCYIHIKRILSMIWKKNLLNLKISRMCQSNLPSLLKLRYKKGAHRESCPCQYMYWGWLTTQALSTRLNLRCPSQEESSSSYWWQRGMSTSICYIKASTVTTDQVKYELWYYLTSHKREKKKTEKSCTSYVRKYCECKNINLKHFTFFMTLNMPLGLSQDTWRK
jgi:hypothetical protein